jgi:hypothetical protein
LTRYSGDKAFHPEFADGLLIRIFGGKTGLEEILKKDLTNLDEIIFVQE